MIEQPFEGTDFIKETIPKGIPTEKLSEEKVKNKTKKKVSPKPNVHKFTIQELLTKCKTLDKKIENILKNEPSLFFIKKKQDDVPVGFKTIDEWKNSVKAYLQEVNDLIKLRDIYKRAILLSNAKKQVTIRGKTMTIVEAIEHKAIYMQYLKIILNLYIKQKQKFEEAYNKEIMEMERKLEGIALASLNPEKVYGNSITASDLMSKETKGSYEEVRKILEKIHKVELVEGTSQKIDLIIKELSEEIQQFEEEFDSQLTIANVNTVVTVDLNLSKK